jgi:heptosyltransferase-3
MAQDPARILVVATQRLGDVLLATPLMRSVRRAWPQAQLDALVFDDTASVLTFNPDLRQVLTVPRRPKRLEHLRLLSSLWRRYDLALSTGAGDRPTMYASIAGKRSLGLLEPGAKQWWKRLALDAWVPFDNFDTHTVAMNLRLADLAGIARAHEITLAWDHRDESSVRDLIGETPYAVVHMHPKFAYKAWNAAGWREVIRWLAARPLRVVLTGSNDNEDLAATAALLPRLPEHVLDTSGRFTLSQVAYLISRAQLYIGPDTVTTHLSAALGTPTIALFGPSNPVKWGPWPQRCTAEHSPYRRVGTQRVGNVFLVQGEGPCVPCMFEGCDRHLRSDSACLQNLQPGLVITAAQTMLMDGVP